jgi:Lrp/AsnC family transcriptional regulator, regulator for asnA, asnC and gidA
MKRRKTPIEMDAFNREIIRHLRKGRKSFDEIAKALSLSINTVRSRVRRLTAEGVLEITGVIDPEKIENHFLAIIAVKLKNMNLIKKGEEFRNLKGVVSVAIVTGQFDLLVTVLLNSEFSLLDFLTKELSKISEVLSTETFVVYKNYNMKVPYVL